MDALDNLVRLDNHIDIDASGNSTIYGMMAHKFYFWDSEQPENLSYKSHPKFTKNKHFVYEQNGNEWILRAAQSTKDGAIKFMKPNRVLLSIY